MTLGWVNDLKLQCPVKVKLLPFKEPPMATPNKLTLLLANSLIKSGCKSSFT